MEATEIDMTVEGLAADLVLGNLHMEVREGVKQRRI
jgi:hypothetical protein